jgi:hypothetical protein
MTCLGHHQALLRHDAPGADVLVPDLAVAHVASGPTPGSPTSSPLVLISVLGQVRRSMSSVA